MESCTLYLVRHGQTDWNVSRTVQGQKDIPLNINGEMQAKELRNKLKDVHFDAVFSSDLIRAKRTAEILTLERKLAITATHALRERSFGIYEGKLFAEVDKMLGNLLHEYATHPYIIEAKVEPYEHMVSRLFTFIREVAIAYAGKTVLLVSHGGIMKTLLVRVGYCTYEQFPRHGGIDNLSYIRLTSDGADIDIKETSGITIKK